MAETSRRGFRSWGLLAALLLVAVFWWLDSGEEPAPVTADRSGGTSMSPLAPDAAEDAPEAAEDAPGSDSATSMPDRDESGIPYVHVDALPAEATEMLVLIDAGGPYEYAGKDGSTFGNFEGHLPQQRRGYYREYTVETPGLNHRGARRIVTGSGGEFYWTADHYESFERIRR